MTATFPAGGDVPCALLVPADPGAFEIIAFDFSQHSLLVFSR